MIKLKPGDKAPDFALPDQDGKTRTLKEFAGKKLALYFYPKDNTPGCTAEACNLTENFDTLKQAGIAILGVSADNAEKHQKFIDKYNLAFPLIADTERELIQAYGVWGQKKFMGKTYDGILRTTFLINENGIIEHIIEIVKTKDHAAQILTLWKE